MFILHFTTEVTDKVLAERKEREIKEMLNIGSEAAERIIDNAGGRIEVESETKELVLRFIFQGNEKYRADEEFALKDT